MKLDPEHIIQLWHYVDTMLDDEVILEWIEEVTPEYEDPETAEIYFIALWIHFQNGNVLS